MSLDQLNLVTTVIGILILFYFIFLYIWISEKIMKINPGCTPNL